MSLTVLMSLLSVASADPVMPTPLLLETPATPGHSAFLVSLGPDALPRVVGPVAQLSPTAPLKLSWAGADTVALKLKSGTPDAVSPTCAPGGQALGSRPAPQRLARSALALAPGEPQPLEHVWLVARSADGTLLHPATVDRLDGDVLHYVFQQPIALLDSVGAPVVDVLGRVVGVHHTLVEDGAGGAAGQACSLVGTRAAVDPRGISARP